MNAPRRQKCHRRKYLPTTSAWARLLVLLFALAGCSSRKPDIPPAISADSFAALKQRIATIRGLQFSSNFSLDIRIPRPTASEKVTEYGDQSVDRLAEVYKRLGLIPNSTDFAKALLDFERLQQLTFYDPQGAAAVVMPDAQSLATAFVGNRLRVNQIPAVFAITDTLQEQNFHWKEKLRSIPSEDRRLALRGLAYGDIVLTGLAHIAGRQPIKWQDYTQTIGRLTTALNRLASDLPPLLRDKLIFPYRDGTQFVQWAHAVHGTRGVDALFADPPMSTAQILHPEKYYTQRENPLRIVPWALIRQMKEPAVVDQTLGEYLIRQLIALNLSDTQAAQLASGWTGDQLLAYRDGDNLITCWIVAWDKEMSAQNFARAFQLVLERRHHLRFTQNQSGSMKADLGAGRSAVIQFKGQVVVLLDGVSAARELQLRASIWEELEISTEPPAMPFDSARLKVQLASRSR